MTSEIKKVDLQYVLNSQIKINVIVYIFFSVHQLFFFHTPTPPLSRLFCFNLLLPCPLCVYVAGEKY